MVIIPKLKERGLMILFMILTINIVSAISYSDCSIYGNCEPVRQLSLSGGSNYSIYVNDSLYWGGRLNLGGLTEAIITTNDITGSTITATTSIQNNGNYFGTDQIYADASNTALLLIEDSANLKTKTLEVDTIAEEVLCANDILIKEGSITSTSGAIDFGNENLTTTGLITTGNLDVDTLNLNGNVISDSTGEISFSDDDVYTEGNIGAVGASSAVVANTMEMSSGSITDTTGAISFGNENLLTTGTFGSNTITATIGTNNFGLNIISTDEGAFISAEDNSARYYWGSGGGDWKVLNNANQPLIIADSSDIELNRETHIITSAEEGLELQGTSSSANAIVKFTNDVPTTNTMYGNIRSGSAIAGGWMVRNANSHDLYWSANGELGVGTYSPDTSFRGTFSESVTGNTGVIAINPNTGNTARSSYYLDVNGDRLAITKYCDNYATTPELAGNTLITDLSGGKICFWDVTNSNIAFDISSNGDGATCYDNFTVEGKTYMKENLDVDGNLNMTTGNITINNGIPYLNQAVCYSAGGRLGHCTDAVNATGGCTCVAN